MQIPPLRLTALKFAFSATLAAPHQPAMLDFPATRVHHCRPLAPSTLGLNIRWRNCMPAGASSIGPSVLAAFVGLFLVGSTRAEVLITPQEAKLPSDNFSERGALTGPRVILVSPPRHAGPVKSPVKLQLKFEGRDGVSVDLNSLAITYERSPPVDLTQRVKEFARPDGIDMPAAEVPPGSHRIRVELTDANGRLGGTEFTLEVAP